MARGSYRRLATRGRGRSPQPSRCACAVLFQVWALIHRASKLMKGATGNACNMDVLCWWVHGLGPYASNGYFTP